MSLDVEVLDICLPDYWQGRSTDDTKEIMLIVPVWGDMTIEELIESLLEDFEGGLLIDA